MSGSLRNLKRETRILGLDACNPKITIGAIVRGGLYLDGVFASPPKISAVELAGEITETKYFPELRVIMVHDPKHRLNSRIIRRITAIPLIQVPFGVKTGSRNGGSPEDWSSLNWRRTRLDHSTIRRIFDLTQVMGALPEPARIAHLLAKLHIWSPLER